MLGYWGTSILMDDSASIHIWKCPAEIFDYRTIDGEYIRNVRPEH